ncbi:MAG: hypothetical protein QXD25_01260 [Nanopusillaceae archaeon]
MNISDLLKNPQEIDKKVEKFFDKFSSDELEKIIPYLTSPILLYKCAIKIGKQLPPEKEKSLLVHPILAHQYNLKIKKQKWKELEEVIKCYSELALEYAYFILNDRFKEGESSIIVSPKSLKIYIKFLKSIDKLEEFYNDYPFLKSSS